MAKLLEITGKAISGEWGQDDDTGTGIPVLRTTNFTNEGFVNYKNVVTRSISKKNIAEKYLRHGDVIIEKSGGSDKQPVGRVIFFEGEENKYLFNNFTGLLRVQNPEEWLPKYVFYALYAYYRNGGTRAFENRTTGLHNLQVDNYVKSVDIPKLSYRKQQHICETLDHVRDAVAYRERQLTKLDELIKARFVEMFGDPKDNRSNLVKIGEIGDLTSGGTPSRSNSEYFNGSIRWYSAGELNSLYLPDSIEHISKTALSQSAAKLFEKGTLMIGMYDTAAFKMGILTEQSSSNQACANLKPTEQYSVIWLYYLFDIMKPIFLNERQGVRQKNLSLSKIRNFNIPSAPIDLQNNFAAFVERVEQQRQTVQRSLEKLELMKKALMQEYFG